MTKLILTLARVQNANQCKSWLPRLSFTSQKMLGSLVKKAIILHEILQAFKGELDVTNSGNKAVELFRASGIHTH